MCSGPLDKFTDVMKYKDQLNCKEPSYNKQL